MSITIEQAPKTSIIIEQASQKFEVTRGKSYIYFRKGVLWHDCRFTVKMGAKITEYQVNTDVNIGYGRVIDMRSLQKDLDACVPESSTETESLDSFFSSLAKKTLDIGNKYIKGLVLTHVQSSVVPAEKIAKDIFDIDFTTSRLRDYFMIKT